ncbi:LysR family transcriptional regulator [Vibrio sp. JPW-9-11-11]|uniref:LysR family transcriptional regulator n=1 Tax=Vibrio sp. JPW-9-11-11 TaxID=1416532 RepID=UPI001593D5B9|nr:LysR family transcriptional regulator [Vibrio sp. JPW-9-11-11]NVD08659.1 LysR family transcriptional regulator [Vibrio sp. JPW-9-11-11]
MLNPAWLKTFATLIDTGHFTKTADKLFMTQPGVSQHIKKLEQACGHALIERHNKSFEITEAGKTVYQYALELDSQQRQMLQSLSQDDPFAGQVSFSCSGALALLLYPHLLDLQCKHPQLITQLEVAPQHKILADIINGDIDIGIITHQTSDPRVESVKIGDEPLCLMLPKASNPQSLDLQQLKALGVIRHPDAEHYLSLYFSRCAEPDLATINIHQLPVTGYVNQLSQILLPVAKGRGFTVLPKSALEAFSDKENITVYQPKQTVIQPLYMLTKRHRRLPARFTTIRDTIQQTLQQYT